MKVITGGTIDHKTWTAKVTYEEAPEDNGVTAALARVLLDLTFGPDVAKGIAESQKGEFHAART